MDISQLVRVSDYEWRIAPFGRMRVPAVIYADQALILEMDQKVYEQITNVAMLPGIVKAAYAMPDAHWGYGFPIGGVAAFDPDEGGVISAGGVGFDISCGVRTLHTGLKAEEVAPVKQKLADRLFSKVPAGMGSTGRLHLDAGEMDAMLRGGAQWAVKRGYGTAADLERIEEHGCMAGAEPDKVSEHAKHRQRDEVGTLGSGNHYLELQEIAEIYDSEVADRFRLRQGEIVVSIHCGSRGLGHQIGTEFLKQMVIAAPGYGIQLPDRELACAPISSPLGQDYLGAMRAAVNCALANRQVITHLTHAQAKTVGRFRIEDLDDFLQFEVMVAGTQRADLVALAALGLVRHLAGFGSGHAAMLLDTIQIGRTAVAVLDRPARAAAQHRIHLVRIQPQRAGAAHTGRDVCEQAVGQPLLERRNLVCPEPGVEGAHAAGNVEPHPAGRHHAAGVGIERCHPADRKAVAPVRVRHGIGRLDDARQGGDVGELFQDFVVHFADQRLVGKDHRRHAHPADRRDLPFDLRHLLKLGKIHPDTPG